MEHVFRPSCTTRGILIQARRYARMARSYRKSGLQHGTNYRHLSWLEGERAWFLQEARRTREAWRKWREWARQQPPESNAYADWATMEKEGSSPRGAV